MNDIINKNKLEDLLTAKWASFLDFRKVIAFVIAEVRDYKDFSIYEEENLPEKGVEIKVTRFSLRSNGFLMWIDFTVPREKGFIIGTCEAFLTNTGVLTSKQIVGNYLSKKC